jgi:hypothetical protein
MVSPTVTRQQGVLDDGPGTRARATPQRQAVAAWWERLPDARRQHLVALGDDDPLPGVVALDLQMAGVGVLAVGTVARGDGFEGLYEQPEVLRELLEGVRARG